MKKLSQINEGMFSGIIRRSNSDQVKKEDILLGNIKSLKPVDLGPECPVLFADMDLKINGKDRFKWEEVEDYIIPSLENTKWRLPKGLKEIEKIFWDDNQPPEWKSFYKTEWIPQEYGSIENPETGEKLFFPTDKIYGDKYWCNWDNNDKIRVKVDTARGFEVGKPEHYYGCLIRTNNYSRNDTCKVRLIQDKKINEGMFSGIIRRSNSDQVKKEDSYKNIKTVDMGGSVLWAEKDLEIEGTYLFDFDEIEQYIKGTGWRLPTNKDLSELDSAVFSVDDSSYYLKNKYGELVFDKKGFWYHTIDNIIDRDFYYGWTSDKYNDHICIFTFDYTGFIHTPEKIDTVLDYVTQAKGDKLCVRLVKDK